MARKYCITYLDTKAPVAQLVRRTFSSRQVAINHALATTGVLIRVETPAGNLVRYVDNRLVTQHA